METRDILNYLGETIGQMQLPDGTSEEVWAAKLAPFAAAPPSAESQLETALQRSVSQSRLWSDEIIEAFKKNNLAYFLTSGLTNEEIILKSLWVHHRMRATEINVGGLPMTIDLLNLCISGDLETAFVALSYMTPDDMSMPYHFLSQEKINELKTLIGDKVGMA
jgi:hypothetical protein